MSVHLCHLYSQEHSRAASLSCSKLHSDVTTLTNVGVRETGGAWKEKVDSLSTELSEFASSQTRTIAQTREMVDMFATEDIKPDLPTGEQTMERVVQGVSHVNSHDLSKYTNA